MCDYDSFKYFQPSPFFCQTGLLHLMQENCVLSPALLSLSLTNSPQLAQRTLFTASFANSF